MSSANGSLAPKPWWRTRKAHSAAGPGRSVAVDLREVAYCSPDTSAKILDDLTVGFRYRSLTAIVDRTGVRSRTLFLLIAGLIDPSAGRIRAHRTSSSRGIGTAALIHGASPLDPTLTVRSALIAPLSTTGATVDVDTLHKAIDLTGIRTFLDAMVADLNLMQRFRVLVATALVCGGDLVLVDDPVYLTTRADRSAALSLVRAVADQGSCVLMATASPASAAIADRAIILTNGRLSADIVTPTEEELAQNLTYLKDNPSTILGPIPSAAPSIDSAQPDRNEFSEEIVVDEDDAEHAAVEESEDEAEAEAEFERGPGARSSIFRPLTHSEAADAKTAAPADFFADVAVFDEEPEDDTAPGAGPADEGDASGGTDEVAVDDGTDLVEDTRTPYEETLEAEFADAERFAAETPVALVDADSARETADFPASRANRHGDDDPITQAIRTLAVAHKDAPSRSSTTSRAPSSPSDIASHERVQDAARVRKA